MPAVFADLAKKASDLINKKYDFKHAVSTKNKASGGLTFETGGVSNKGAQDGYTKFKLKDGRFGEVEGEVHTNAGDAKTTGKVKLTKLAQGVEVTVSGTAVPDAKIKAQYKQEHLAVEGSLNTDLTAGKLGLSAVVGYEGVSVGGAAKINLSGNGADFTGYDAGLAYAQGDFQAAVIASKSLSNITASFFHNFNKDLTLAGSVFVDNSEKPKGDARLVTLGSEYKLDKATTIKAKVNTAQNFSTAVEHKLASPALKVTFASSFNLGSCDSCFQADKWGLGLVFGDY